MYDVIIVGGGIAGMTSAIYATRRELKTLLIATDIGGQMAKNTDIENWPGEAHLNGAILSLNIQKQAKKFGTDFKNESVNEIKSNKKLFTIKTFKSSYQSKTIILAFGKTPRKLNIPGEEKLIGRGISYCVTCDGPFFRNKIVAVVGGGNSAIDATLMMSKIAKKVYLIHRRDQFRAEEYVLNKVKKTSNIEILPNTSLSEAIGTDKLNSVKLNNGSLIKLDGLLIEIGYLVDNTLVKDMVKVDKKNQIIVDQNQMTSFPGIFSAGDLTNTPFQQLVIAAGEGATAALSAYNYIQKNY